MRNYSGSFIVPVVISALIALVTIILMIWGIRGAIGADVDCLSKSQARAKYPKQWIYWHGVNQCWDNVPVRKARTPPPPSLVAKGHATTVPDQLPRPTVFYPALMGGGGTSNEMLTPHPINEWPLITDFDKDPPAFIPWQRVSALIK